MNWHEASNHLHERVIEEAQITDSLALALVKLHGPQPDFGMPACHGCDRGSIVGADPLWPCRTYTLLAQTLLRVRDIECLINDLRRGAGEVMIARPSRP